jgi:predicted nucleic acid-binding protein
MTVVLDAQGLTMLAKSRARLEELRRRGEWPAVLPAVVLTECLTGDHRRDYHENRVLRTCDVKPVDEPLARSAALLRAQVVARRAPSAVDAIVVALADFVGGGTVLSSDPADLRALARHTVHRVDVAPA